MNKQVKLITGAVGAVLALLVFLFVNPFTTNDAGYRTHVQRLNGEEFVRFEAGMFYAGFFAKTTTYPDVVTIQFEDEADWKDDVNFVSGLVTPQFSDGTYAKVGFTVKWELPSPGDEISDNDPEQDMIKIHHDYRSTRRLAQSLADYAKECINYSTPLMDSERHYSGGKSELADHFKFQLRNGQYILDQNEIVITDPKTGETLKRSYENERRVDDNGNFILSKSDVQAYNIVPNFVAITHVDYEQIVDEKLQAKVEQSTKESIAKQTLVTAQQEALTAKAQGERMLAEKRAQEEASKLEAVIRKEKEVELARLAADQAKYDALKVKYDGEAKAAANQALVRAGLTPQERARIEKETAIGVAAEFAKIKFPEMMIFGGGQGAPTDPIQALGIKSMLDIQHQMQAKKGN